MQIYTSNVEKQQKAKFYMVTTENPFFDYKSHQIFLKAKDTKFTEMYNTKQKFLFLRKKLVFSFSILDINFNSFQWNQNLLNPF